MADRVGQQLGNYRLIRLLGRGGFAEVYLGEHIHLNTQVAIKVLHTQLTNKDLKDFLEEIRTLVQLRHPHIVRVLEVGVEQRVPFLVMSYAPNGTLLERHRRGTILPPTTIILYVKQIADALQYLHDRKLINRNIDPAHILLGPNDELLLTMDPQISLGDRQRIGTPSPYWAPEELRDKPGSASDQYALGVTVYEWLSGTFPYRPFDLVRSSRSSLREKVPMIHPHVDEVVMTALALEPMQRFPSVEAFANALEQAFRSTSQVPQATTASSTIIAPAGPMVATLSGPSGRTILGSNVVTVGRGSGNHIVINDRSVSKRHAEVRPDGQNYSIVDLNSLNGTFVNEQRLAPETAYQLKRGDTIRIGGTQFIYEGGGAPEFNKHQFGISDVAERSMVGDNSRITPAPPFLSPAVGSAGAVADWSVSASMLERDITGATRLPAEEYQLSLFAITYAALEERDRAFVGKTYSVQAGISQNKPENFRGTPFNLAVQSLTEPLSFDILLHESENIELMTNWHKNLIYRPDNLEPQLVEFRFRVVAPGESSLVIDFYHERRWLRTIRLEFDAVEQSQFIPVSSEV